MEHLAVVTGASSGIGFELAKYATGKDYDLIVAADEPQIETAAEKLRAKGAKVIAVQADLATRGGVDKLYDAIRTCGRPNRSRDPCRRRRSKNFVPARFR
jgi:uncharacterized protein